MQNTYFISYPLYMRFCLHTSSIQNTTGAFPRYSLLFLLYLVYLSPTLPHLFFLSLILLITFPFSFPAPFHFLARFLVLLIRCIRHPPSPSPIPFSFTSVRDIPSYGIKGIYCPNNAVPFFIYLPHRLIRLLTSLFVRSFYDGCIFILLFLRLFSCFHRDS